MKSIFKTFFLALLLIGQVNFAYAQTAQSAALLPNATQVFLDNNGKVLSSGKIYFYIPGTTTSKMVWQDDSQTTPWTQPIILTAAGRPPGDKGIYGNGVYRQQVKDKNNNIIWDQPTSATGSGGAGGSAVGDGNSVGTILTWSGMIAPNQYQFAYGQSLVRATYPELLQAVTLNTNLNCVGGNTTLTGIADTSNIPVGAAIEANCVVAGSTVISKTINTVTISVAANISTSTTGRFFPYGNGDGSTTFNVPDLRGKVIPGRTNMGGVVASNLTSTYYGSSPDAIGAIGGNQSQTLITGNLPPYTPIGTVAITDPGHTHSYTQVISGSGVLNGFGLTTTTSQTGKSFTGITAAFAGTAQGGTSTAFAIIPPSITLNYVIKVTPDTSVSGLFGVASIGGMQGVIACGSGVTCAGNTISANINTAGEALTKTDDTNIILSLSGSPSNALLHASNISAGWNGTLAAGRLNSNVVQSIINDTNINGAISTQALTFSWAGTLAVPRGGTGTNTFIANNPILGNGTSALTQGTRSGNTTVFGTVSGSLVSGNCLKSDANGNIIDQGSTCGGGGTGSPGGANGQIQYNNAGLFGGFTASGDATINTATGAVAVTKTGGIAFAPSATTDATNANNISSGMLNTMRLPSPFTGGSASGNTSKFATVSGSPTSGNCAKWDANGNVVDAGAACGSSTNAPINVVAVYGADPTGTTDNLSILNSAITATCAAGGGRLYFPKGTYLISNVLTISCSDVGIEGDGEELTTIITNSVTATDVVAFVGTLVSPLQHPFIKNISIGRSVTPTPGSATNGLRASFTVWFQVENVLSYNSVTQFYFVDDAALYVSHTLAFRTAAAVNNSDLYVGMHITSTNAAVVGGFTNDQPRILNFTSLALTSNGITYGATSYGLIYDGYNMRNFSCEACDLDTTTYGAYVDGTNIINGNLAGDIRFSNSTADSYGIAGFYFKALTMPNLAVSIIGGFSAPGYVAVPSTPSYGIYAENIYSLSVIGTVQSGINNVGFSVGARVQATSQNIQFTNNFFRNFYKGIDLQGFALGVVLSNNTFYQDATGTYGQTALFNISLTNIAGATINGNISNGTSAGQVATAIFNGGGNSNIKMTENYCNLGAVTSCSNGMSGSGNVVSNNTGINPVGPAAITTSASPYTYTASASYESVYCSASTGISAATQSAVSVLPAALTANVPLALGLGPGEAVTITYTGTLNCKKMVH